MREIVGESAEKTIARQSSLRTGEEGSLPRAPPRQPRHRGEPFFFGGLADSWVRIKPALTTSLK